MGDVDGHLIHADASADGCGLSVNMDEGAVGERAEVAVAIADGNDGDAAVVLILMGSTVTAETAGGHFFDGDDLGVYAHAGLKVEVGAEMFGVVAAVDGEAGADEVEMALGLVDEGGGVGGMANEGSIFGEGVEEGGELLVEVGGIGIV